MTNDPSIAHAGNLALMVSAQKKRYLITLMPGQQLQTHRGVLNHDDLIGKSWGTRVNSHLGSSYLLLQPSLSDLLMEIKRNTQIMYPKDIGYILLAMDINSGKKVLEAGSGSGALTTVLAATVGSTGHVYSYDNRESLQNLAKKNILKVGLEERVTFKIGDVGDGFEECNLDAIFLDLPNPYDYLPQVRQSLKSGGFFGSILPTTNQVSKLVFSLHREKFAFTDVCEIMLRFYKNSADRFRPTDRMVAHTGYLIFSRPVIDVLDEESDTLIDPGDPTEEFTD